jgi:CRISPR system Cascade subunit CasA
MDLLRSAWIPVQNQISGGQSRKLTLRQLLCSDTRWSLSLPRDDLEFAALQLLVCMVQVLFPPVDKDGLQQRIRKPMSEKEYETGIQSMEDWFCVDHPEYPFMQVKGVKANIVTSLDKLLAGLDTATNSRFVNEPGLADRLCGGCAAVALYNQANNAPSFGGGFKFGLRGTCPVSTLIQTCMPEYNHLRTTIWFNVLTTENLENEISLIRPKACNDPTWVTVISNRASIGAEDIGFVRGLFWQPNHVELCGPNEGGRCSLCGHRVDKLYDGFYKAKFNFNVEGLWPHPHSPKILMRKKGQILEKFYNYTTAAPSWTQLSRFVVQKELEDGQQEGRSPAAVLLQAKAYWRQLKNRLVFMAGGYRNNQASIVERRHDTLVLNSGWQDYSEIVEELVEVGLGFRAALDASLKTFSGGIKSKDRKTKGIGLDVYKLGEKQFYRRSEGVMVESFSTIDFESPRASFEKIEHALSGTCRDIFENLTEPYVHEPELLRTRAIARRVLEKRLKEIRT